MRRPYRHAAAVLGVLLLSAPGGLAVAQESWTLTFQYRSEVTAAAGGAAAKGVDTATGTLSLQINAAREISGGGTVSAVSTMAVAGVSSSRGTGHGPCTVTGKRDDQYLHFSFRGEIKLTGQTTVTVPGVGAQVTPYNSTLDCRSIAESVAIERKNGATVTSTNRSGPGANPNATVVITTTFALSGGPAETTPTPPPGLYPPDPDIWTLEFEFTGSGANAAGAWRESVKGSADFPLPLKDGPVRGEGPLKVTFTPPASTEEGKLHLDGEVQGEQLTFIVGFSFQKVRVSNVLTWGGSMSGGPTTLADNPGTGTVMPLQDGAEITQDVPVTGGTGKMTCRLKGHRREKWEVLIKGWDTHCRGSGIPPIFGMRIHWQMLITIWLRDGQYESGSGQSSLGDLESYSVPPDLYTMTVVTGSYISKDLVRHPTPYVNVPSYSVPGKKLGSRSFELTFPKDSQEPIYAVTYRCTLNPDAARKLGFDPDTLKPFGGGKTVVVRSVSGRKVRLETAGLEKTSVERAIGEFPLFRTVTLTEGWHHEEGDLNSVDYEQITVTRLR